MIPERDYPGDIPDDGIYLVVIQTMVGAFVLGSLAALALFIAWLVIAQPLVAAGTAVFLAGSYFVGKRVVQ